MTSIVRVLLWGSTIGVAALEKGSIFATFQYTPEFIDSGIEVSPLTMPLRSEPYQFPALPYETFRGLPGLLADSLPDRFGNTLINLWLAGQGRSPESFNAIERLCYTGSRSMGALEFMPVRGPKATTSQKLQIDALVALASEILSQRNRLSISLSDHHETLKHILRVGTSAGGARAKAVIAWNRETGEVRSGQVTAPPDFSYWLLKFDGVSGNKDKELEDPKGFGAIEYAYYLMALDAGIGMEESRLLEEGGRRHFMTRRFDRTDDGKKIHMLSLAALAHYDFNNPTAYSYEQAFLVMRRLGLSMPEMEQMFRRMVFNILARNQDDHVKNIAFLMNRDGQWRLSPAFDITYSYNPEGLWTARHQMAMNSKRDGFTLQDFSECGRTIPLKRGRAADIVREIGGIIHQWPGYADSAGIPPDTTLQIQQAHRLSDAVTSGR